MPGWHLAQVPLLQDLNVNQLSRISVALEVEAFSDGQVIFRQGDPGNMMYIVLWGHVQIWQHEKTRAEKRADAERMRRRQERKEAAEALKAAGLDALHGIEEEEEEVRCAPAPRAWPGTASV